MYFLAAIIDFIALVLIIVNFINDDERRGSKFQRHVLRCIGAYLIITIFMSIGFYDNNDPATANIIVWVAAVPILAAGAFSLLLIFFDSNNN
jgi:hypothetical protein